MIGLCLLLVAGSIFSIGRGVVVEDYMRNMKNSATEVAHYAYAVAEEGTMDNWMLSMMLSSVAWTRTTDQPFTPMKMQMRIRQSHWKICLEAMTNEFNKKNVDDSHRKIAHAYLYGICQRCNHKAEHRIPGSKRDLRHEELHQRLCERDQAVLHMDYE